MIPYRRRIAGVKCPGLMKQLDWIAGGDPVAENGFLAYRIVETSRWTSGTSPFSLEKINMWVEDEAAPHVISSTLGCAAPRFQRFPLARCACLAGLAFLPMWCLVSINRPGRWQSPPKLSLYQEPYPPISFCISRRK